MPAPLHGQVNVTGTAAAITATPTLTAAFTLQAPLTNANPIFVGASTVTTTTGFQIDPGAAIDYEHNDQHGQNKYVLNLSDFYVVGTTGDKLTWLGSPQVAGG